MMIDQMTLTSPVEMVRSPSVAGNGSCCCGGGRPRHLQLSGSRVNGAGDRRRGKTVVHLQRRRFLLTAHGNQMLIVPTTLSLLLTLLLIQQPLMLQR